MNFPAIAHIRKKDGKKQTIEEHLLSTAELSFLFAQKIGLGDIGRLLGLLHDFGKYSRDFQDYIRSGSGLINPDIDEEYIDAKSQKGEIDHSTAGAQWIYDECLKYGIKGEIIGKILSVCLSSHHGGLIDCLQPDGTNYFRNRINKKDEQTHRNECLKRVDHEIKQEIESLISSKVLEKFWKKIAIIAPSYSQKTTKESDPELAIKQFHLGLFTRFLFSCLIDADRIDSADFEMPENKIIRDKKRQKILWEQAIERLNKKLAQFPVTPSKKDGEMHISAIRQNISNTCYEKAKAPQGIFTLTVPTGGGKTLSSMRFALQHAKKYDLDHIIYVIPYTSIIEQNAREIRNIVERNDDKFSWVLEHHSNLEPEEQTWQSKLSAENWDAPIIFTTIVQFLESLFGGGTRGARKMHNLARSVIIFDEIQCIPIKSVHLFTNAINFLCNHCKTTAVLCTATQPLLDNLRDKERYGGLNIPKENEIIPDVSKLFQQLERVKIVNKCKPSGWNKDEITDFICQQFAKKENSLVIVNTKAWAKELYESCKEQLEEKEGIFHLATSLCPAHRKKILEEIRKRIEPKKNKPTLCISTQLIEAGVDVDFNVVIRFLAGFDSIAQAAGRCNRNGRNKISDVFIFNPKEENISMLHDIQQGVEISRRIFSETEKNNYLDPEVLTEYFNYYFYARANEMAYPLSVKQIGRNNDNLFNILAGNIYNSGREKDEAKALYFLQQSFKSAGRAFKVIDAPTQAVLVPYAKGKELIAELGAAFEPAKSYRLLREAQQFSVNVFPNIWQKLLTENAIYQIQEGAELYALKEEYYNDNFGLDTEPSGRMSLQSV